MTRRRTGIASALVAAAVTGDAVSSHGTPSHAPVVESSQNFIVDKGAGETLIVDLERRGSRAVITGVR